MGELLNKVLLKGDPLLQKMSRRAPCEERLLDHLEMLLQMERAGEEIFWQTLAEICKADYWAYLRFILQLRWLDPWWHGEEIVGFLKSTTGKDRIIMVPRGTGKTTCITIPYPSWAVAKHPELLCITTNATDTKAARMTRAQARIVSNNSLYRKCFPNVVPSEKWGKDGYVIDIQAALGSDTTVDRVDSTFSSYGVGGNLTGSHVGLIMADDLINQKTYKYPLELQKAEDFLLESFNCLDSQDTMILCCTRWTYLDLYGKVASGQIVGHKGQFEVMKRGIWKDGKHGGEVVWPERVYFDQRGNKKKAGQTTQQILNTYDKYEKQGQKGLFNALYLNEPVPEEDIEFEIEMIQTYSKLPFGVGGVRGLGIEAESQGKALVSVAKEMRRDEARTLRIDVLTSERIKKETRIRAALGPLIARGGLHLPEHVWKSSDGLGEEIRVFDKGGDDLLDATVHCLKNAKKARDGEDPEPYVALDPAFSEKSYADRTAIVCGCWFADDFWVLDTQAFKDERAQIIIRRAFQMVDKWNRRRGGEDASFDRRRRVGFDSRLLRASGEQAQFGTSFTCDLGPAFNRRRFDEDGGI